MVFLVVLGARELPAALSAREKCACRARHARHRRLLPLRAPGVSPYGPRRRRRRRSRGDQEAARQSPAPSRPSYSSATPTASACIASRSTTSTRAASTTPTSSARTTFPATANRKLLDYYAVASAAATRLPRRSAPADGGRRADRSRPGQRAVRQAADRNRYNPAAHRPTNTEEPSRVSSSRRHRTLPSQGRRRPEGRDRALRARPRVARIRRRRRGRQIASARARAQSEHLQGVPTARRRATEDRPPRLRDPDADRRRQRRPAPRRPDAQERDVEDARATSARPSRSSPTRRRPPSAKAKSSASATAAPARASQAALPQRFRQGNLREHLRNCWKEAIAFGTKVINELRLPLADPQAQKAWDQHIRDFLNLK